jgi:hypothetical protein
MEEKADVAFVDDEEEAAFLLRRRSWPSKVHWA